ncbi:MAG: ribonuclease H-like domain-containing protein [Bryobacterales bacterium]|nr:ribonuclease H-like domain-containing protein [Bryobacterales bacterium]MDE0265150.1 ribonuclease H-like domain-containing protein [Bryobacterales bacterium]
MQRITQGDINALRRRMQLREERPASSPPAPQPPQSARKGSTTSTLSRGIEGTEQVTSLGTFLLQEHFYPNERSHGSVQIGCLQSLPCDAMHDIVGEQLRSTDANRWVFLDTETTGLAGGTGTCAFLVGIGMIEEGGFRVQLYFMRDFDEEHAMLDALAQTLAQYDTVITFNGKAFDVPLLETRYRLKRLRNPFRGMDHVDLLHPSRRLWKERLGSCRLTNLESHVLGVERQGDIPGALIPQCYFDYLRSGDGSKLAAVFHHNVLDIVSLACINSVLLTILASPDRTSLRHGQDMHGLARWLNKLGREGQALTLYRTAIHSGLPRRDLFAALWETAQIECRAGRHEEQIQLLRDLARVSAMHRAAAFVELAKHYEHRLKDYALALKMTRNAQRHAPSEELCHRERRILRKLSATAKEGEAEAAAAGADSPG